ncbi:MAG: ADP-ribosylglycohydrolase family protein, partial [Alphaproteobacteria bacterium]
EFEQDPESYFASNVFAGHPGVAADLLGRDARPSIAGSTDAPDHERLVSLHVPRREDLVRDPGVLSRAHGALLGQVVGDALGQMVEFESEESVRSKYPGGLREIRDGGTWNTIAGQPTDDSEMALALARSILRANGYDPEVVRTVYGEWRKTGPFDIGITTAAGIEGAPLVDSKSNGSLMRVSPLAVHGAYRDRDALVRDARADSRLTHPNATCIDSVAAFCVAIAHAIRTGEGPAEVYAATAAWVRSQPSFSPEVAEVFAGSDVEAPARLDGSHDQGYVVHALRNAFHQLLAPRSFEEALVATVSRGGDTDTNGAIAGALLGAVHGRDAIPARWRAAVLSCRPMPETSRPRPTTFWPVDVLHLAEALLSLGGAEGVR